MNWLSTVLLFALASRSVSRINLKTAQYFSTVNSNSCSDPDAPECLAAINCPNLDDIENGNVEFFSTMIGSPATYSCDLGFELIGDETRVCIETAQWSGEEPECERK